MTMNSPLYESLVSLKNSTFLARVSSKNLVRSLSKSKISANKLFADERRVTRIFEEKNRRRKKEELLEAGSVGRNLSGSIGSVASKGKGFLGRIMGAIGSLFLGWIIQNYPEISRRISEFKITIDGIIQRGKIFFGEVKQFFKDGKTFITTKIKEIKQNFDFEGLKAGAEVAINDLASKFEQMKDQFFDTYDWITKNLPNNVFEFLGIPVPNFLQPEPEFYGPGGDPSGSGRGQAQQRPEQSQQQPPQQQQQQQQPPSSSRNKDLWTLVAIAALEDSDPQGRADVAQSIYNRRRAGSKYGFRGGTIAGLILEGNGKQYQPVERAVTEFRGITDREGAIKAIMKADNLSRGVAEKEIDNTLRALTNPTLQKNARAWVEGRTDFYSPKLKAPQGAVPLRQRNPGDNQFGSFVGPGSKRYAREDDNRYIAAGAPTGITQRTPRSRLETFKGAEITGNTGTSVGNRPANSPVSIPNSPFDPRDTGGATITSAMGERWGRQHNGLDIAAAKGTPLFAYLPGKVTRNMYEKSYGNLIEWRDSVYNQLHVFAHMMKPSPLRVGQTFDSGEMLGRVGDTGRSTGPHLHWEIGPQGDELDPVDWVKTHLGKERAYMGPTMQQKTNNIAVVQQPQSQQMMPTGEGSSTTVVAMERDLLNRMMRLKLAYT